LYDIPKGAVANGVSGYGRGFPQTKEEVMGITIPGDKTKYKYSISLGSLKKISIFLVI
jgi:hypothetical protein